jgi:hypothetical protein
VVTSIPTPSDVSMAVVTLNGDVYGAASIDGPWTHRSNVFSGPTSVQPTTFGAIKAKFRR